MYFYKTEKYQFKKSPNKKYTVYHMYKDLFVNIFLRIIILGTQFRFYFLILRE